MKTFTTTFNKLRTNDSLRLDFGIRYVDDILDYNPLGIKNNFIILSDVLSEIKSKKVKKGELEDPEFLIDLENINKRFNSLINVERVTAIDSDKTILQNGDLVIAKMTPKLGTMFLNTDHTKYLGSTELVEYKISGYDSLALYYILTSQNYLDVLGYMESGKNQRRVKPSDLLKLKIPLETKPFIEYAKQANDSIFDMFSKKKNMQQIIDASFLKELSISQKHSNKQLLTKLSVVGEDSFCRFSFHNQNYFNTFVAINFNYSP